MLAGTTFQNVRVSAINLVGPFSKRLIDGSRMLAGTTYPVTIKRLGRFFVGFSRFWLANAGGSTWYASKTLAGSKPAAGPSNGFSNLSPIVVASAGAHSQVVCVVRAK